MSTDKEFVRARATYEMTCSDLEGLGDDYSDEEADLLSGAHFAAMDTLLLTAAPDFATLVYKMETFAAEGCFDMARKDELFAALVNDVRRLGG